MPNSNRDAFSDKQLLAIGPWALDPHSARKREIISDEFGRQGWITIWPSNPGDEQCFALAPWVDKISNATLVLADLSFERPSCYYELGCVEAMNRAVVVIAETGTPIHQTSHRDAVMFFNGLDEYQDVVRQIICRNL